MTSHTDISTHSQNDLRQPNKLITAYSTLVGSGSGGYFI